MNKLFFIIPLIAFTAFSVTAQKGIDQQTQKIRDEGVKVGGSQRNSDQPNKFFDFGKGKTKTREQLANPYRMNGRRDILVANVLEVLKEQKLFINENASRQNDGFIVTEPLIFAKGAVITRNELNRYAVLPNSDASWTRGRYTLIIDVQSIDGIQNNVSVTAKVEGRSENGLQSEWTTLQSTGAAEEEFLVKLVELVTGAAVNPAQDGDQ